MFTLHPYRDKPPFDPCSFIDVSSNLPHLNLGQTTSSFSLENEMADIVLHSEPIRIDLNTCKKLSEALAKRTLSRMEALRGTLFLTHKNIHRPD